MKKILSLLSLLCALFSFAADYYWVGGSGNWSEINHWRTTSGGSALPSVIPGPKDNVFFDAKSGFTDTSKTITIDNTANCHNITFSGSGVAPTVKQNGAQTLNVYGSSEWQSGMVIIDVYSIYYRHTGEAKTIKSNGVKTGLAYGHVYFEEESSISLADDFFAAGNLYHQVGTWNTNNNNVTIDASFDATSAKKAVTINLGSSHIFMNLVHATFKTNSSLVTLNAGTSTIHFTTFVVGYNNPSYGLFPYPGQTYHNIIFEASGGVINTVNGTMPNANFNNVEFKGNGNIYGDNTFKNLILAPTKTYLLEPNKTQTITNLLSANTSQCGGWSTITSMQPGTASTIKANSATTINVSGVIMKDIHASGGADFTANNSVNNGNNTGWTFPPYTGQNLYWVGGSGNWNDKAHWSQESGGIGGYCVPGPTDNTFFDEKSGFTTNNSTVTIDNISYTKDITFSGSTIAPMVKQNGVQTLNIYGSSEWQTAMPKIDIQNIYYRHTGEAKTIKSNGVKTGLFYGDVYFEEESSISLVDDFYAFGALYQQAGTWNTNNNNVTIEISYNATLGKKAVTTNLGSSHIYMNLVHAVFYTYSPLVTLNSGTSTIHFKTFDAGYNGTSYGLFAYPGQTYYDVIFEASGGVINSINTHISNVNFNNVEFKGNGNVYGNNTFKNLILAPTKTYLFEQSKSQTITNLLSANTSQCGGWSTITSTQPGTASTIKASSATTINVSGVIMKDLHASGGTDFTANNSVNNGNNTGWTFPPYTGQNLYWVGGSGNWNDKAHWSQNSGGIGGYCVPGPTDNTFFDEGSGFTKNNNTVTVDNISYTKDITFSGSPLPPVVTQNGFQTLNIYGSSEWQKDMEIIKVTNIYYRHTGEAKTIKSNGAKTGIAHGNLYLEEENSISLTDDFFAAGNVYQQAGTWNTNNNNVTLDVSFNATLSKKAVTINLGSSHVYMNLVHATFITNSNLVTFNAGTSTIHFTKFDAGYNGISYGLFPNRGQTYHNVFFEGSGGVINNNSGTINTNFNSVKFVGHGNIYGNNSFKDLFFAAGKTYILGDRTTQTIENLTLGGTPCDVTFVQSSVAGTRANMNITGSTTEFNFGNLKDINASGKQIHFAEQSTIANQNNSNITFAPYNTGAFSGLGSDWIDHKIDNNNPSTYMLTTNGFYGNMYTTYKWYKLNDSRYDPTKVISTSKDIDIRDFGMGTYRIEVSYSDGTRVTCEVPEEILIKSLYLPKVYVNPNLRIRAK